MLASQFIIFFASIKNSKILSKLNAWSLYIKATEGIFHEGMQHPLELPFEKINRGLGVPRGIEFHPWLGNVGIQPSIPWGSLLPP